MTTLDGQFALLSLKSKDIKLVLETGASRRTAVMSPYVAAARMVRRRPENIKRAERNLIAIFLGVVLLNTCRASSLFIMVPRFCS